MPRTCSLCKRADQDAIAEAIRRGDSLRSIALQFGTSHATVKRHKQHVLKETAVAAPAIQRVGEISAKNFLEDLLRMKDRAEKWFQVAEKEGNATAGVIMMRECRQIIETLVKLAMIQRQLDAELTSGKQIYKDVTPGVLAIINAEYETEEERELRENPIGDWRKPGFLTPQTEPRASRPETAIPEPPVPRIRLRCLREHSFFGKLWAPGQIWDSANPDGPKPPDGEDWQIYNPPEERESSGLLPTRRR